MGANTPHVFWPMAPKLMGAWRILVVQGMKALQMPSFFKI